ncbi:MAG: hypothetical protein M3456_02240 [Actinomycetota bacterium]|nr:hypothetical protein [Actinomycetota bacterium]
MPDRPADEAWTARRFSTIGRERRTNPALQLDPELFLDYQLASTPPLPQEFLRIKTANKS